MDSMHLNDTLKESQSLHSYISVMYSSYVLRLLYHYFHPLVFQRIPFKKTHFNDLVESLQFHLTLSLCPSFQLA